MRWPLIALAVVLLLTFPHLLGLVGVFVEQPVIVAFGLGAAAALGSRRTRTARARRRRR